MFCAKAASLLHGCTDNLCHCCGLLNLQSNKLQCFMAGLDNLINNNYDYAIAAMAVPAASLATLAPGYAHARFGLPNVCAFDTCEGPGPSKGPFALHSALQHWLGRRSCTSSCALCERIQLADCLLWAFP